MKEQLLNFLFEQDIIFEEIPVPEGPFPPDDYFWNSSKIRRCKNLFFRDNHGKNHFLVVFDYYKKLEIKKLSDIVGRGSLSFASGWRLEKYLGLSPGFLSVFGILNDKDNHVKVILDSDLDSNERLSFLPNTLGESFICLEFKELVNFIRAKGNELMIAELT